MKVTKIRLFIACPGDVLSECKTIIRTVNEINDCIGHRIGIVIDPIHWKSHTTSGMGRPQAAVFEQLDAHSWDVFIGVLWGRFGTVTGAKKPNGKSYFSGTEEEFNVAYSLWNKTKRPRLLMFRCTRQITPTNIDTAQLKRINSFFSQFRAGGEHPGLVHEFKSSTELEKLVRRALCQLLFPNAKDEWPASIEQHEASVVPKKEGILGLYTSGRNDLRNSAKSRIIREEKTLLRMSACAGVSYLETINARFGPDLEDALERGVVFRAVLINPWTYTGLLIGLGHHAVNHGKSMDEIVANQKLSSAEAIEIIEQSPYYNIALKHAFERVSNLQRKFGNQVELRLTKHEMSATVLLGTTEAFFEPYVQAALHLRNRKAMHMFEIQCTEKADLYKVCSSYFTMLWNSGVSSIQFRKREEGYKLRLKNIIEYI